MTIVSTKLIAGLAVLTAALVANASRADACGTLEPGTSLQAGEQMLSCTGNYNLTMQNDGNLVQYNSAGRAQWWTGTHNEWGYCWDDQTQTSQCSETFGFYFTVVNWAVMQGDGNFVEYARISQYDQGDNLLSFRDKAIWNSQTWNHAGSHIAIQDDGNLVVYDPAWRVLWARW